VKENESPDCIDTVFNDDGSKSKRLGVELLNKAPTGAYTCNGLFDYGVSPGVRKLVGAWATTIQKMDDLDGTWDSLETGRTDCPHYFERSGTKLIICNEQRDTIKYWDGSATSLTALNTNAPLARIPKPFQGYLFLANTAVNPRRIWFEDESTITTGDYAEYFTLPSSSDDEVLAMVEYNGRLYTSLRGEWYRISYVGGSAVFDYKKVSSVIGGVPKTIQVVSLPNIGEVILYFGWNKKIYVFDGTSSYAISEKYENDNGECPVYLDSVNQGGLANAHAVVDIERGMYRLYVPIGGDSEITHRFDISLNSLSCSPAKTQPYSASCIAEDSNKKRWHILGGYDGCAYKADRLAYDEIPMNNVEIGADGSLVSVETYIRDANGICRDKVHDGGNNVTYAEDSSENFVTLGVAVGDYIINKTDTYRHVITAINNGGGVNAQLDYANTEDDTDNNDVFDVYKAAFIADDDSIYIGSARRFDTVVVELIQNASATITPLFYYSADTAGTYTALTVTDGTSGFIKSGVIKFSIPSGWTKTNRDDGNNAFADTTTYYYIRIRRTANSLTTTPKLSRISVGLAIDDYYSSPKMYGKVVSALKKGLRMYMYFTPAGNYGLQYKDRKDFESDYVLRDTIPMYNTGDNFLGLNLVLNSNELGSRQKGLERSIDIPVCNNSYQYRLTSNKAVNIPWKLHTTEFVERQTGIGVSKKK
jgi:hypothetical protein